MSKTNDENDIDAGSRKHVLDWLESKGFLKSLAEIASPAGLVVNESSIWQPKCRADHRESTLVNDIDPFLCKSDRECLLDWWLIHKVGKKPTWDLISTASNSSGNKALVLVEAKAHAKELEIDGKERVERDTEDKQKRTDENHVRIGEAISEASSALSELYPDVSISRDRNYQFANRIAYSWKLASMGIPVVLVYLGFIGDTEFANYFASEADWIDAFEKHIQCDFPLSAIGKEVNCGDASFWLFCSSIPVTHPSPPASERKRLP